MGDSPGDAANPEGAPQVVTTTTTTTTTTKVTVTSDSTEDEKDEEVSGDVDTSNPPDDGGPEVALSDEESQLLEKLKYQPFAVAQDIENLTPEQREKINLYQRRESLARGSSLKRGNQSPPAVSAATVSGLASNQQKRPSQSSQGCRDSDYVPSVSSEQQQSPATANSDALNEESYASKKENSTQEQTQETKPEEEQVEENVDTSSEVYQQMKLFTPKPSSHSIDSQSNGTIDDPSVAILTSRSSYTPSLDRKLHNQSGISSPARHSTLPVTSRNKLSSAGDLSQPSSPTSPTKNGGTDEIMSRMERTRSVKETKEETDRMRQQMYEMKRKFLGENIPAVYPYKLATDAEPPGGKDEDDEIVDDVIDGPTNVKTVESGNPSALLPSGDKSKKSEKKKGEKDSSADKKKKEKGDELSSNKQQPKKQQSKPFFKLLCGGGKSKNNEDATEEPY